MTSNFSGGCLCGAVRYECAAAPIVSGHCQCNDCRRASGTGHGSHMMVPKEALSVTGEVRFFDKPADSANIVSRGFCPVCGSAVYSRNSGYPDALFVRASSLDDLSVFQPSLSVYASRGALWDHIDPALPKFATMPPEVPQDTSEVA